MDWRAKVELFEQIRRESDRKAPRKQRHTAHRIWERIQHEPAFPARSCVGGRTAEPSDRQSCTLVRETCVPQSYAWGVDAQVDWYEAYADLAGERVKLPMLRSKGIEMLRSKGIEMLGRRDSAAAQRAQKRVLQFGVIV